ncbi:MAG: LamG domain-containing protein, partial [Planctomycetota bacterium]
VKVVADPRGGCVKLDGKGYLQIAHHAKLDLTGACTLAAWVAPEKLGGGGARIIDKSRAATANGYLLDTYPGNSLRLIVEPGTLVHRAKLPPGKWSHVAGTYDAETGRQRLFVNGRQVAEQAVGAEASQVAQGYALQRFIQACAGRGNSPIKFNGSIFTVDARHGKEQFDADYRRWGGPYWFQNTRLAYWPMLAAGDTEMMRPLFRMYRDALPLAKERTRVYFDHAGACFPETMYFWGAYANDNFGWNRKGKPVSHCDNTYIRHYWSGALELTMLMLDHHAHTGDDAFVTSTLLPLAEPILAFYDEHYPRDAEGKLLLEPAQALETWQKAINPLPPIAGLHAVLDRLLALPDRLVPAAQRRAWQRLRGKLPDLPKKTVDGQTVLLPAEKVLEGARNSENPELYAVFPYRLYGVGKPHLEVARATFARRRVKRTGGWTQDPIQAALLGLADTASRYTAQNFARKDPGSRFPAFWGPNFDWIPDQDHGSVALMALQAMLLQADGGKILLFPAWPKSWDVDFQLHAPRRTTVQGAYRDGALQELTVTPAARREDLVVLEPQ